jgi:hypothetical protein
MEQKYIEVDKEMKSLINEYLVLYHSALQLSKKSSNMARH